MNIVLIGCEHTGKTTLAGKIMAWMEEIFGESSHFHDHFTVPCDELSPEAQASYLKLHPQAKELLQRYMIRYHTSPEFYSNAHHNLLGHVIEEAVYAPLYYGYGCKNSGAPRRSPEGERTELARTIEQIMLERAPGTVMVLLTASPEIIRLRMKENPHTHQIVRDVDVEHVLRRFEEEYAESLIQRKFALDTSRTTPEQTMTQFISKYEPFHTVGDRKLMAAHTATMASDSPGCFTV